MTQSELTIIILSIFLATVASNVLIPKASNRYLRKTRGKKIVVDTSALMDGRITAIARAGFLPGQLLVPRPVIRELQLMADKADPAKRQRARYGLDTINELQQIKGVSIRIIARDKHELVDEQLITLAKQYGALLFTTDYNLNKVAKVEGIGVLNVNELAHAVQTQYMPGEKFRVTLTQAGQSRSQAVGHLEDGTMVVVDDAKRYIGSEIDCMVSKIIQTQAGKMLFATINRSSK